MKSSTRRPTSLSAKAVTTAVLRPKHLRRPRATLYSPPPSQALKLRAVRMRMSPGSRRSITSPRETWSNLQEDLGLIASKGMGFSVILASVKSFRFSFPSHYRHGRRAQSRHLSPVPRLQQLRRHHEAPAHRHHALHREVV